MSIEQKIQQGNKKKGESDRILPDTLKIATILHPETKVFCNFYAIFEKSL